MKIAMLHYHLQPGGVTRVVANHLLALDAVVDETVEVKLLHNGTTTGFPETIQLEHVRFSHHPLPELAYDSHHQCNAKDVYNAIIAVLQQQGCQPHDTVIHIHNHSLGKNAALTACLPELAKAGWRLLLQIHDFAEDFRPAEFTHLRDRHELRHGAWYPQSAHIHYATLNARDHQLLSEAGIPDERLHLLPNPVLPEPPGDAEVGRAALEARFGDALREEYVLYPVRGISRKQVGEFCLHAALAEDERCYGMSLAPGNPWQRPSYDCWRDLANQHNLPCLFETGSTNDLRFCDHLAAADHLLTTSVAEGFGMVFLESCLTGHIILGRDLPEITNDFRRDGLQFPGLHRDFRIPISWIGRVDWQNAFLVAFTQTLEAYGQEIPPRSQLLHCLDNLVDDQTIDFATCTRDLQERIVVLAASDPERRDELRRLNHDPVRRHSSTNLHLVKDNNRKAVTTAYSMPAIGERLLHSYHSLLHCEATDVRPLRGAASLLRGFIEPYRFAPIRINPA